ncbi:MAG TPA: MFS transporter [Sporosarcina sp.]|nr:MFS transporter [Sporosarcina sp.]
MGISTKVEKQKQPSTLGLVLLVVGIIFIAMNLRAPITSVGPVASLIRDNLHISNTMVGVLTTIPLLTFGVLSPFAPKLARRFGMELTLFFVLIVLTIGLILRPFAGIIPLYVGTLFIGAGIAVANVLMPAFVKMKFPKNIGVMTGIYSISMNLTAALAAGLSVPLSKMHDASWKLSIGIWMIVGILAILFWLPQLRNRVKTTSGKGQTAKKSSLLRSPLAWKITIFMGLQSLLFYCIAAWLPEILQGRGMSANKAGWMLSSVQFAQLPVTFIAPIIAGKMKNQIALVWLTFVTAILGIVCIMSGIMVLVLPAAILFGIATGLAFSLAMMFFTLRTDDVFEAADLSAMAQSIGYLVAASGPVIFGILFDMTDTWTSSLVLLLVASLILLIVGLGAGKQTTIAQEAEKHASSM